MQRCKCRWQAGLSNSCNITDFEMPTHTVIIIILPLMDKKKHLSLFVLSSARYYKYNRSRVSYWCVMNELLYLKPCRAIGFMVPFGNKDIYWGTCPSHGLYPHICVWLYTHTYYTVSQTFRAWAQYLTSKGNEQKPPLLCSLSRPR